MDDRYSRQIRLDFWGDAAQTRLRRACVLLVGCGGTGSHLAEGLVRAGVGTLRIVDRDIVALSNLPRQALYTDDDARNSAPKAFAAAAHLRAINPEAVIEPHTADLTAAEIDELATGADLILDGTDNFATRWLINDWCVKHGIPWIYTAAIRDTAISMPILPGETACLQCLMDSLPAPGSDETCDTVGVYSPTVTTAAALSLGEALKILVGQHDLVRRTLWFVRQWEAEWVRLSTATRNPDCLACGHREFPSLIVEEHPQGLSARVCGRNAVHITPPKTDSARLNLQALASRLAPVADVDAHTHWLGVTVDGNHLTLFADGRAIVEGTADPLVGKAFYARIIAT